MVFSLLYITSASAGMGVNVGVSGNAGIFAASAKESNPTSGLDTGNGSEHGSAAWGSIFLEGVINDQFMVGIDYVPGALSTDTTETAKSDFVPDGENNLPTYSSNTNKIQERIQ